MLQENPVLSSDRLIRVREKDLKSLAEPGKSRSVVSSGDLCVFRRIDTDKILIGRIVQFLYLEGNKRQQEYSGMYVDLTKDSYKSIGAFANLFSLVECDNPELLTFTPLKDVFTAGYISMKKYVCTIPDANLMTTESASFALPSNMLVEDLDNWKEMLTEQSEFLAYE